MSENSGISQPPKYEGATVKLQDLTLIIPPLNFRLLRREGCAEKLQKVTDYFNAVTKQSDDQVKVSIPDEIMDLIAELVWKAAKRNYPELTLETIEENLDYNNCSRAVGILAYQNPLNVVKNQGNEGTPQAQAKK
jgi:hypothetical protein